MKALEILKRCLEAEGEIQRIEARIEQWRDVLDSLSAPQADPNGGSRGSGETDKIGRILGNIDQLEREKRAREEAYAAERVAACALMDMVPDLEGQILYDYYARRWNTGQIARKRKYTPGYVRKTKRGAEKLLEMLSAEQVDATLPAWYLREKGGVD